MFKRNLTMRFPDTRPVIFLTISVVAALMLSASGVAAQEKQLILLYTFGTNGYLEACPCSKESLGGLAKRMTIINDTRDAFRETTVLVDAGNLLSPYRKNQARDRLVTEVIKKMKYDALNIGEQEVLYGQNFLAETLGKEPLTTSNAVSAAGSQLGAPYIIKTVGGVRFGIIGAITEMCVSGAAPDIRSAMSVQPTLKAVEESVKLVRAQNPDVVVLLLRSVELDMEKKIAGQVKGIDFIVSGSGFDAKPDAVQVDKTYLLYPGHDGEYIGRLRVMWDESTKSIKSVRNDLVSLSKRVTREEEVEKAIQNFKIGVGNR